MDRKDKVFFDIETQHSFDEVGGRRNLHQLKLSVAVTIRGMQDTYQSFLESQVEELFEELKNADLVIGFNIIRFDYPVLQPYTKFQLSSLPTFDILADIHSHLGFRVSLDSLAINTLGTHKSADGLQAIRWYREGRMDELIEYCRMDVEITKRIYEFGQENGFVVYFDRYRRQPRKLLVDWQQ